MARLSQNDNVDEGLKDDTIKELEDALHAFIEQCGQRNELAFALTYFTGGGLSRLALAVFATEKWDVGPSFNLPF